MSLQARVSGICISRINAKSPAPTPITFFTAQCFWHLYQVIVVSMLRAPPYFLRNPMFLECVSGYRRINAKRPPYFLRSPIFLESLSGYRRINAKGHPYFLRSPIFLESLSSYQCKELPLTFIPIPCFWNLYQVIVLSMLSAPPYFLCCHMLLESVSSNFLFNAKSFHLLSSQP